jgi:hypothetical protein
MIAPIYTRLFLKINRYSIRISLVLLICICLMSCTVSPNISPLPSTVSLTKFPGTPEITSTLSIPITPQDSITPSPVSIGPQVILIVPPGADLVLADELQKILSGLAGKSGYLFEIRTSLTDDELIQNLKIVVAIPPDPGLSNLVASAPGVQFLGVNIPGLNPASNLSTIGSQETYPTQIGFLAGYLAAAVTYEWRVGAINVGDTPQGLIIQQGFVNGVVYFCGLCKQLYPPYNIYPLYINLPSSSNTSEWQAAADIMVSKAVKTVFLAPGAGDEALLLRLAEKDVNIIGTNPPPSSIKDHWIATLSVSYDQPIENIWADLMNNKGGYEENTSFSLTNINEDLFSPGKQNMVMEFISDLWSGMIDPGIKP